MVLQKHTFVQKTLLFGCHYKVVSFILVIDNVFQADSKFFVQIIEKFLIENEIDDNFKLEIDGHFAISENKRNALLNCPVVLICLLQVALVCLASLASASTFSPVILSSPQLSSAAYSAFCIL